MEGWNFIRKKADFHHGYGMCSTGGFTADGKKVKVSGLSLTRFNVFPNLYDILLFCGSVLWNIDTALFHTMEVNSDQRFSQLNNNKSIKGMVHSSLSSSCHFKPV